MDDWIIGLTLTGVASIAGALNFILTIINLRAPGMSFNRMPLFVWMTLVVSFLLVFAFPSLTVAQFQLLFDRIFGPGGFLGPAFVRTFLYVVAASALCLLLAYPVAYYVTRYAGRRKGLLLVALLAPFWVSYMMRMLAWVNLLENDGMVNRLLVSTRLLAEPFPWLAGQPVTVTLGLVYGYIPYMVLALYAGLDRVDQRLLEAARDLGASRRRTFVLVTLPLSRQAILAGLVVTALPMFGDYFTNDLLSGSPRTSMVGNLINDAIGSPGQGGQAAALVLVMMVLLAVPMLGYIRSTGRAARDAGR